ncbi:hypothetical protein [Asticcacaulis sp. AC460]|uniref:hypothetical protein n=1 Tax=Asticcacaulis sp. AC460 TaxID=1282360 RepID=UPI0012DFDC80|nr:hypothetical protein [Asticcacaulis sp. AC460]
MTWTDLSQGFVRQETIRIRRALEAAAEAAVAEIEDRMPWARLEVAGSDDEVSVVVVRGGDLAADAVRDQAGEILRTASHKGGR